MWPTESLRRLNWTSSKMTLVHYNHQNLKELETLRKCWSMIALPPSIFYRPSILYKIATFHLTVPLIRIVELI